MWCPRLMLNIRTTRRSCGFSSWASSVAAEAMVGGFGPGSRLGLGQDPAPRGGDQPRAAIAQAAEALGHGQIVSAGYQALISADKERFALVARWVVVWPPLRVPAFVPD